MKFCQKHEIAYQGVNCPVCGLERELQTKEHTIKSLLCFRSSISEDRTLYLEQIAAVLGKSEGTLYQWKYTKYKNIPYEMQGNKLCIKLGNLKRWADLNNMALNLNAIGAYQ